MKFPLEHWSLLNSKGQRWKCRRIMFSLNVILSLIYMCTHMHRHTHAHSLSHTHTLLLSLPSLVIGPYCVSQRKCRHSRGQAIHWSEYRLVSFSASFLPSLELLPRTVSAFPTHCNPLFFSALCVICTPLSYTYIFFVTLWSTTLCVSILSPSICRPFLLLL